MVSREHAIWVQGKGNQERYGLPHPVMMPSLDRSLSALIEDMHQRGLLQNTLVCFVTEMGRTPKVNRYGGRDHWSRCFTIALGGGGIQGGRVVGKSDKWAMDPAESAYGPEDLSATVYQLMGIPPSKELLTPEGRPVMLTNNGRLIRELI